MSILTLTFLAGTMLFTAFLSGVFGMAGGLILIGVLLAMLPLPAAMALHAVTQVASNGWRALLWYRHINLRAAAGFLTGSLLAFVVWASWQVVPSKPVSLLLLGASPFMARLIPARLQPNPLNLTNGMGYGAACMGLLLLTGVSGPLMDTFFLGGRKLDRHAIVATKAGCQVFCHTAKFVYFGSLISDAGTVDPLLAGFGIVASIAGTSLARPVLARMDDSQYRLWANRIIVSVGLFYLAQGSYFLVTS